MTDRTMFITLVICAAGLGAALLILGMLQSCKPACTVISAADTACVVVQYLDEAGTHYVQMPAGDMALLAGLEEKMAAARNARDAGQDGADQ